MRWTTVVGGAVVPFLALGLGASAVGAQVDTTTTVPSPEQTTTTALPLPEETTTTGLPVVAPLPAPEKVTYCHRTNSVLNPYVLHSTAVDSIISQGHGNHTGPIFPEVDANGNWGDIIPAFDYDDGQQHFPGLNWPAGQDVIDGGCAVHETIDPPPEETTTTTAAATTTTATTTTVAVTTTSAVTSTTRPSSVTGASTTTQLAAVTTIAGATTTSLGATVDGTLDATTTLPSTGASPPTAAPAPALLPPVYALLTGEPLPDPLPEISAYVLTRENRIVVLGKLSPDQVRALFRELAERGLPHTGTETGGLVTAALLALGIGGALLAMSWWRRPRPGDEPTP